MIDPADVNKMISEQAEAGVDRVIVSAEQHDALCLLMEQREGFPVRVYCLHGVAIDLKSTE